PHAWHGTLVGCAGGRGQRERRNAQETGAVRSGSQESASGDRMRIATAPVNWNKADVTDYRPWTPYPALLDEMVAAGYTATEWGMNMEKNAARLRDDLHARNVNPLGGFVGLGLRNPGKRAPGV